MWQSNAKFSIAKRGVGNGLVAVAIDKDRGSQHAIRWTIDNLLTRGNTIILIHVLKRAPSSRNYFLSFFQILDLTILPIHALALESIAYCVIVRIIVILAIGIEGECKNMTGMKLELREIRLLYLISI